MGKLGIIKEFFGFIVEHKDWWLLPVVIALLILGILIISSGTFSAAPFIYALF